MKNQIYFHMNFFESLKEFSRTDQKRIMQSIDDLSKTAKSNSLKLHSLNKIDCDSSFRSIRVNSDIRVILSQSGNRFKILHVGHHEEAYNWAKKKKVVTNDFNSTFVYDDSPIITDHPMTINNEVKSEPLLLKSGVKRKHLIKLGLSEEHSDLLLEVTDLDFLVKFISFLPDELQEALIDLALENKSIEDVMVNFEEINDYDDMKNPNSMRRFIDKEELDLYNLDELLSNFDAWKLFLHPKQREYVEKTFNGPALIEGGPGTGKTIVGIHRALHLAHKVFLDKDAQIYFIVFNKRLVNIVEFKLKQLMNLKGIDACIKVIHVDKLVSDLLTQSNLYTEIIDENDIKRFLKNAYNESRCDVSYDFILNEYFEIIRNRGIKTLEEYLKIVRHKKGKSLNKEKREKIWPIFEQVNAQMIKSKMIDFEMRAALLEELIDNESIKPFIDSMIIDEAQDLSAQKIRTLKKLIRNHKNNLFLLSDKNQRIFSLSSWKKDVDIKVQGRTYYLTLNYRTTKEIKEFADLQFSEKSMISPYEKEYKSLLSGPMPKEKDFTSKAQSKKYLVEFIKNTSKKIPYHEICVISDKDQISELSGVLDYAEIPNVNFSKLIDVEDLFEGVNLVQINLVKGLEYRVVILYNIPFENPEIESLGDEDEYFYTLLYQKYECKKYVALTRARDYLFIINIEE